MTMAEYIKRESAISALTSIAMQVSDSKTRTVAKCINAVEMLPISDVAPVRHGRWINHTMIDGHIHAECSECHKVRIIDNFCPNCGAIMDLEG